MRRERQDIQASGLRPQASSLSIRQAKASSGYAPHGVRESEQLVRLPKLRKQWLILVADEANHRIVQTTWHARMWKTHGSNGSGTDQFDAPADVTYDKTTGYIYVADTGNSRVVRTKIDGSGWATHGATNPYGVFADPENDYLYISETGADRIERLKLSTFDGTGSITMGVTGNGDYQFNEPHGIYVNPATGHVYVADRGNHRIVETNMAGNYWDWVGKDDGFGNPIAGNGNYEFDVPYGVFYDADSGFVYASDGGVNDRLSKFTMANTGWEALGTYDARGRLFVNTFTGYIFVLDMAGEVKRTIIDGGAQGTLGSQGSGVYQFGLSSAGGVWCEFEL